MRYYSGFCSILLNVPSRILHADGYVDVSSTTLFNYHLKDHLGNVRIVLQPGGSSGIIKQTTDYYPFGMAFTKNAIDSEEETLAYENKYLYNGKEEQPMPGKWLDYGLRMYDAALGRWHVIDSRAEKYYSNSPYSYCFNNPILFVDPNGDTVRFAGAEEEAAYNSYRNTVNARVNAYDKRTQNIRDKGKTNKADKRDANRSNNAYVQVQGELSAAESNENVFMVRMGNNISNSAGDGNVSYNKGTKEIDVNIASGGGWTTMQKVSHEFKHIDQFINLELDLNPDGGGGLFYDKTDEVAAFKRMNMFGTSSVHPESFVNENYSTRQEGPKSFHLLTPAEQTFYKSLKYIYNGKK